MKIIKLIMVLILALSSSAYGWDGTKTGYINNAGVDTLNGNNAGFRIALKGQPELCGNDKTWAYINKSDDNYQVTVSVLLAAMMGGKKITVYANRKTDWENYCHIGYVSVRSD